MCYICVVQSWFSYTSSRPISWLARSRETPSLLVKYTQTSINSVYFTRLYHEYLRLEGEADKETAIKMITDNESAVSALLDSANQCFKHIYEKEGLSKNAQEAQRYVTLVKTVLDGVMTIWESALITENATEFKSLVRESSIGLELGI